MAVPLIINGVTFNYPVDFDENWGINATGWAQAVTSGMLQMAGGSFPLTADVNFGPNFGLLSKYFETRSASPSTAGTIRLSSADAGIGFRNNANTGDLILTTNALDRLTYPGGLEVDGSVLPSTDGSWNLGLPFHNFLALHIRDIYAYDNSGHAVFIHPSDPTTDYEMMLPPDAGSSGQFLSTDGAGTTTWANAAGSGTINSGTQYQLAYYDTTGISLSGLTLITPARALISDANGLPTASSVTSATLAFLDATSSVQTQINGKLSLTGGTMSGAIAMGSHKITGLTQGTTSGDGIAYPVGTSEISSGAITTAKLATNAVTQSVSAGLGNAVQSTSIRSVSITTTGGLVLVMATASINVTASTVTGASQADISVSVDRDGSGIAGGNQKVSIRGLASTSVTNGLPATILTLDNPSAGSHTYNLKYDSVSGGISVSTNSLVLVELKA